MPRGTPACPYLILHRPHCRLVLCQHHGQGEEEHEQPVAHVAEHHGKEEGEGDDGVGRWGQRGVRSAGPTENLHISVQITRP